MAEKRKINKEALEKAIEGELKETRLRYEKLSGKLGDLLKKDIAEFRRKEKTRGAEMISIFAAHNFYANGLTPEELRTTLEDLGPTYVKIGQIMSSRRDLLPEEYCAELEKLRQNVKPLDPKVARAVIEEETGKGIDELFREFRDEPLGSASIGQAHYGVLLDGTRVVTKVQRPLIAEMMKKDFVLLKKLAERISSAGGNESDQMLDLVSVLDELEKVTNEELDFRVEAEHTRFFKENCIPDSEKISCPDVIDQLTTERIFTMTYVDGYSVSHKDRMLEEGLNPGEIGGAIVENYMYQVLDAGVFHADPHQGNIMVSKGKPYWIDFGMIGRIGKKDIDHIQKIILALLAGDSEGIVDGILAMGTATAKTNRDEAITDVSSFLAGLGGIRSINDIDMSELFGEVSDIASRNHVTMPGEYTMLVRSIITVEGVIEELCPELNLFQIFTDKMKERVRESFDLKEKLSEIGKELISSGKKTVKIPELIAETLSGFSKGKAKVNLNLTGVEEPLHKIGDFVRYVVLVMVSCVLFLGSCLLSMVDIEPKTDGGMPLVAVVGVVFSIALAIFSIRKLFGKR